MFTAQMEDPHDVNEKAKHGDRWGSTHFIQSGDSDLDSKCRLWAAVLDQSSLNSFSPGSEVITVLCLFHQLLSEVVSHANSVNLRAVHVTLPSCSLPSCTGWVWVACNSAFILVSTGWVWFTCNSAFILISQLHRLSQIHMSLCLHTPGWVWVTCHSAFILIA